MPTGPPSLATPTRAPSVPTAVASLTPSRPAQSLKPVQRRRPVSRPTVVIPRRIPVPVVGPVPLPSIRATVIATTPAVTIGPLTVKSARIVVPPVPLLIHPPVAISPVAIPPVAIPPVAVPPVAVPPVTGIPKLP
jgi:hypothetical protein